MVYLDYAATTPVCEKARLAMEPFLTGRFGNPSSMYKEGVAEKVALRKASETIANSIGALFEEILFTSGGTESDNLAIRGFLKAKNISGGHIITSAVEHPAVFETMKALEKENFRVTYLPVSKDGSVSLDDLKNAMCDDTVLVSVMMVNNETGVIMPIRKIGEYLSQRNIMFHVDAVQAVGHMPIDVKDLHVDLLSASSHKFGGPKGVGFLYVKKGTKLSPILYGGEQQHGLRPGTENTAGIAGMSAALSYAYEHPEQAVKIAKLRDYFETQVLEKIENTWVNGINSERMFAHSNITFQGVEGEALLIMLDQEGICASTGSACTMINGKPSRTLLAMGLSEEDTRGSVRFSLGSFTTKEEIDFTVSVLQKRVKYLREIRG